VVNLGMWDEAKQLAAQELKGATSQLSSVTGQEHVRQAGLESLEKQVCCAVLCCAVLCCAVLCCAVLCCAVLVPSPVEACALRESRLRQPACIRAMCMTGDYCHTMILNVSFVFCRQMKPKREWSHGTWTISSSKPLFSQRSSWFRSIFRHLFRAADLSSLNCSTG